MGKRRTSAGHGAETAPLEPTSTRALSVHVLGGAPRAPVLLDRALRVGRDAECDVVLDDRSVSRHHATIEPQGFGAVVMDEGSRNGTTVGGARIGAGERVSVGVGTVVRVGAVPLLLDRAGAPRAALRASTAGGDVLLRPEGPMESVLALAERLAGDDITVLLTGETGVGKEVLARWIHERSPRAAGPFVPVHAAALSPSLFESELFGHERGAFTGATEAREGLLEQAEHGTIFFDEIGELPLDLQPKLLRVLEDRNVTRVGGRKVRTIDVRIVAATNRDLAEEVAAGAFRADLYFRLSAFPLEIPPLRARRAEVVPLARALLAAACRERKRSAIDLEPEAAAMLEAHPWPGNVRELRSVVTRALLLAPASAAQVTAEDLRRALGGRAPASAPRPAPDGDAERARILAALGQHAGNQSAAAAALGIARRTLLYKLDKLGIARPRKVPRAR